MNTQTTNTVLAQIAVQLRAENARLLNNNRELLEALVNIVNWSKAHDAISFIEENAIQQAETASNNAKNIRP